MFTSLEGHFCDLYLQESQLVHSTGFYVLAGWEPLRLYLNNTLGCVPARLEMDSYQKGAIAHVKQSYF